VAGAIYRAMGQNAKGDATNIVSWRQKLETNLKQPKLAMFLKHPLG